MAPVLATMSASVVVRAAVWTLLARSLWWAAYAVDHGQKPPPRGVRRVGVFTPYRAAWARAMVVRREVEAEEHRREIARYYSGGETRA